MPKSYIAPAWEDTGSIDMRSSQNGALGNVAASDFDTWWASADVQANMDIIREKHPLFFLCLFVSVPVFATTGNIFPALSWLPL